MKTVITIVKLVVSYIAFAAAVWLVYWLCGFLPPYGPGEIIYPIILYTIIYMVPALLAFGYSLLVYAALKNSPKRFLIALLNCIAITAVSIALMVWVKELGRYIIQVPASCVLSIIMSPVLLALRPKSLPKTETAPEAAEEG